MKRTRLRISTPEGIVFSLPLAGPISRFLAWTIDCVVVVAAGSVLSMVLVPLGLLSADLAAAAAMLGYFVLSIGYGIATEWFWRGQTLGKRLLSIRVMDEAALALRPHQVVIRNLLRALDSFPLLYLLGGAVMLLSRNGQRLGDYAAGTVVVFARKHRLPDLEPLLQTKYNTLREQPHLAARLAQQLSPDEAALGVRALQRRNELLPQARVALFNQLASFYRKRVTFPEELVEHLADEQYVKNVVDVVYRPSSAGPSSPVGRP